LVIFSFNAGLLYYIIGYAEVICRDKTGTLTMGEMTARKLITSESLYRFTGEGYSTDCTFFSENVESLPSKRFDLSALLRASATCNDAELTSIDDRPAIVGDSADAKLLLVAATGDIARATI
jgi:P-type Ca2+ transporter type 2C